MSGDAGKDEESLRKELKWRFDREKTIKKATYDTVSGKKISDSFTTRPSKWEGGVQQSEDCALCEKYGDEIGCYYCPLFEAWGMSCGDENSPFWFWTFTPYPYKNKYGRQIWNDLKELLREAEEEANDD